MTPDLDHHETFLSPGMTLLASEGTPPSADAALFPIVGVGSSAGGLNALTRFLSKLPAITGMAFVFIQHLDPTHESHLRALLGPSTPLPIVTASDGLVLAPNHIYLIQPNTSLTITSGTIRIRPRGESPKPHLSIDLFFQSLATDRPGRAIGIVLSGTGTDGSLGLAAIKAAGGITFAQDNTADHDGMPLAAISSGCVDFILPPDEIALEIEKIAVHGFPMVRAVPHPLVEGEDQERIDDIAVLPEETEYLASILDIVRTRVGIDFSQYRPTTIKRRIIRRFGVLDLTTLQAYARYIEAHHEETSLLVKDLLINVTSFYRDRAAFNALTSVVFPNLMADRLKTDPIRIWVAGCSTGQEVYSIAIELLEFLKNTTPLPTIQIFGSDISEWALTKARTGSYSSTATEDVPAARLTEYFTKDYLGYRINKNVRDLCVFAKHDITADPPFSKMDLITCRNVLIYLAPPLQMKVFQTFHFALKPSGLLLLGSVESLGRSSDLFSTLDPKLRIFQKKATTRRIHALQSKVKPLDLTRMKPPSQPFIPTVTDMQRAADRIALGRFVPAGVLVNESLDIIQFRGQTHPYLEPAQGEASLHLLTMVPFSVADALKEAIIEATDLKLPVRREGVPMRRGDLFREISFEVIPVLMAAAHAGCFLILFDAPPPAPVDMVPPRVITIAPPEGLSADAREILQLRNELTAAHDHIQSITEQSRSLNEQLSTAHEESSSTSEEFRSTNEELQTAKEEVDATNEELITVNEELRNSNHTLAKSMELTAAIVETMRYPLLVLDANLNVESANHAFLTAFHVTSEHTIGQRIYQLGNGQWDIPELRRLLEDILPNNSAFDDFKVSHNFSYIGQRTILVNARRLQTVQPQPRIVLVFADITDANRIALDLEIKSQELLRSNEELDQFAGVASHDLQEPLRMISSYIKLIELRNASLFDDKSRQFMGFVTSGAERMSIMIKAILAYSKVGREGEGFVRTDSLESLSNAKKNLEAKIDRAQATVTNGPLPMLLSNSEQLTQLFQNLLSNGIKFRSNKRQSTVHVSAVESESEWIFSVADNGIGMQKKHFDNIFILFQRLHSASEYPGTGIGLATCKKIVGHHRGRIWVDSTPDIGSTFYFSIPK